MIYYCKKSVSRLLTFIFLMGAIQSFSQHQWKNFYSPLEVIAYYDNADTLWMATQFTIIKHVKPTNHATIIDLKSYVPFGSINDLTRDNLNNIWLATDNGLIKYTNGNYTIYDNSNSAVVSKTVTAVAFDPQRNIVWAGATSSNDISLIAYDGTNFTAHQANGLNVVRKIHIDSATGNLTIACYGGLASFDGSNYTYLNSPPPGIADAAFSNDGKILLGMDNSSILEYNGTSYNQIGLWNNNQYPNTGNRKATLAYDQNKNKWICGQSGLVKIDTFGTQTHYIDTNSTLAHNAICTTIFLDHQQNKWISTDSSYAKTDLINPTNYFPTKTINTNYTGISRITPTSYGAKYFTENSFLADFDIITDTIAEHVATGVTNQMACWLPIGRLGMDALDNAWLNNKCQIICYNQHILIDSTSLLQSAINTSTNTINSIFVDSKNRKWIGGDGIICMHNDSSLTVFNAATSNFPNNGVTYITEDLAGNIWIGTYGANVYSGAARYDGNTWVTFTTANSGMLSNEIRDIVTSPDGKIWISHSNGVSIYDGSNWSQLSQMTGKIVNDIEFDQNGTAWIATAYQLYSLDMNNVLTMYDYHNYPITGYVTNIHIDAANTKWFTYNANYLTAFNENGITTYTAPKNKYNSLKGKVYNDINGNKIQDANEPGVANQKIVVSPNGFIGYTNSSGVYDISVLNGNYSISPVLSNASLTTDSLAYHVHLSNSNSSNLDFGVHYNVSSDSLTLSLTGGYSKCDETVSYWIDMTNNGSNTLSGILKFTKAAVTQFVNAIPSASSASADTILWNITPPLSPGEHRQLTVNLTLPNYTFAGTNLLYTAGFKSSSLNQQVQLSQFLTCSFDPNEKQVNALKGFYQDSIAQKGDFLDYTIHFQNTGTDTAKTVRIMDQIDANLDINSIQVLGSSHPYSMQRAGRVMTFLFNNINLPDTNVSFQNSQGFIKYRIKSYSPVSNNSLVNNTGYIYFDNNPPVITNTTRTYLSDFTGIKELKKDLNLVSLYPNPADNMIQIAMNGDRKMESLNYSIYNILGNIVKTGSIHFSSKTNAQITTQELVPGYYLITLHQGNFSETHKVIIQR
ncbi:MAG: T9SS type A sorting domain-containing protein [Bacteroidetes bacterium]|nr:T9SS type A sorting domain-containing protein [Bacteroidota bacterium]